MRIQASFDDGTVEDIRLANMLKKYDFDVIFYFPYYSNLCNERNGRTSLSPAQRQDIARDFEIGSHTMTHPMLTRIKPIQAKVEIEHSRIALQDEFGQPIDSFCYPRGYANPDLQKMVRKAGYKTARSTLVGNIEAPNNPYFIETSVHICGKRRQEYKDTTWFDEGVRLLDEAIERAKTEEDIVYSMFGHSWEIERYNGWDDVELFFKTIYDKTKEAA